MSELRGALKHKDSHFQATSSRFTEISEKHLCCIGINAVSERLELAALARVARALPA